jgi:two-component system CheB/CheR fusion protein
MPREAVAAGAVDSQLSPERLAEELAHIGQHPLLRPEPRPVDGEAEAQRDLARVLEIVQQETGMDFDNYRHKTLQRRIARRMLLHKVQHMSRYTNLLRENPQEVQTLYQDFLISVTSFFRDPAAFDVLKKLVFPALTQGKSRNEMVRAWVLGCSTGEEAYSIAMAYTEYLEESGRRTPMQVLASDVNAAGIEKARAGVYPKGIEQDVSAQRLRFFNEVNGAYRVVKPIRDMCIFARHNSLTDPPFSHIDLVSCRNLLIYLEPVLQKKVMSLLHYSLRPNGFLWLGYSESANAYSELFEPRDAKHRFYSRKPGAHIRAAIRPPLEPREAARRVSFERPANSEHDPQKDAERLLLARYVPAGVVLDNELNVVQFRGDTSPYLVPPQGRASLNLLKMLREGLLVGVRGALHQAAHERKTVRQQGLRVRTEAGIRRVDIVAMPIVTDGGLNGVVLLFERPGEGAAAQARQKISDTKARKRTKDEPETADEEAHRLRQELASTREYLQSDRRGDERGVAVGERGGAVGERGAAERQRRAGNLQGGDPVGERGAVDHERGAPGSQQRARAERRGLRQPVHERRPAGRDARLGIADPKLHAGRREALQFPSHDVGRPLNEINLNLVREDMDGILARILRDGSVFESEVQDRQGRWYWLRVRPYRTHGDEVHGALVTLVDVDALKRSASASARSKGASRRSPTVHRCSSGSTVSRAASS